MGKLEFDEDQLGLTNSRLVSAAALQALASADPEVKGLMKDELRRHGRRERARQAGTDWSMEGRGAFLGGGLVAVILGALWAFNNPYSELIIGIVIGFFAYPIVIGSCKALWGGCCWCARKCGWE